MIIDAVLNGARYAALSPNFATAFRFLKETDLAALEPGKIAIDGEKVFATMYDNFLDKTAFSYEAHDRYADIQVVVEGAERFALGWDAQIGDLKPGKDFRPGTATVYTENTLTAGQFVIYLPGELHAPGNPAGAPARCRKLVVKVLCE